MTEITKKALIESLFLHIDNANPLNYRSKVAKIKEIVVKVINKLDLANVAMSEENSNLIKTSAYMVDVIKRLAAENKRLCDVASEVAADRNRFYKEKLAFEHEIGELVNDIEHLKSQLGTNNKAPMHIPISDEAGDSKNATT